MTKSVAPKTNSDLVQPVVDRAKSAVAEGLKWARENPDEVLVTVAPMLAVAYATRRHALTTAEDFIAFEVGYWCGQLALQQYRQWKTRPAAGRSLREVV